MKKIKKNLKLITLIVVMVIVSGSIFLKYSLTKRANDGINMENLELNKIEKEEQNEADMTENNIAEEENSIQNVFVDIKGAVKKPGVYEVSEDIKVIDVVELAGGFTDDADTSMINLAKKVTNEMVIIIYTEEEMKKVGEQDSVIKIIEKECICPEINNDACINQETNKSEISNDGNTPTDKVNINNSNIDQLLTLPGIGESKAQAIIEYRNTNGNFQNIEDIMQVSGIGEALYEKIKNYITV